MTGLKKDNLNQCFSLLREFIDGASGSKGKRETAVLALDHLQRITGGDSGKPQDLRGCVYELRIVT